jgi:hypothetical protein
MRVGHSRFVSDRVLMVTLPLLLTMGLYWVRGSQDVMEVTWGRGMRSARAFSVITITP